MSQVSHFAHAEPDKQDRHDRHDTLLGLLPLADYQAYHAYSAYQANIIANAIYEKKASAIADRSLMRKERDLNPRYLLRGMRP